MSLITVFTPAYNRACLLQRLYESLEQQSYKDFEWLVVDDGSTDETKSLMEKLQKSNDHDFPIRYLKKENGGKHTAINVGVKEAKGQLFLILDSDDSLPERSLEIIAKYYKEISENISFGGVCGLMAHHNGTQIGSGFPEKTMDIDEISLRYKQNVTGDLLEVFRTSVMREFLFPEIKSEKFCPEQLVWFRIAQKYKLRCFNKVVYYRDYLDGGLTDKIVRIRMNSPIASCLTYGEMLRYKIPFLQKVKVAINYWRFWLCLNRKEGDKNREFLPAINRFWSVLFPIGAMMHWGDKRNMKKGEA